MASKEKRLQLKIETQRKTWYNRFKRMKLYIQGGWIHEPNILYERIFYVSGQ